MFPGIDRDYYKGASDKELVELLGEWDHLVLRQTKEAQMSGPGGNKNNHHNSSGGRVKNGLASGAGRRHSLVDSSQDTSTSSVSTGSIFMRHHRYADHTMAYRQSSDPYECSEEARREAAFQSQRKVLGRPFEAGGRGGGCGKPSRMLLGDCVRELYQAVTQDWLDADPVIITTAEDLIVLYFRLTKRRHRDVLRRYMDGCLLRNTTCREYDLRKVQEGWNRITDDGHLMFTVRPLWVPPQRFLPDGMRGGGSGKRCSGTSKKQP